MLPSSLLWAAEEKASDKDLDKLEGRVEERANFQRIGRPSLPGAGLNKFVQILPGETPVLVPTASLNGGSEEDILNSMLSESNFKMPYSSVAPKLDKIPPQRLQRMARAGCDPCLEHLRRLRAMGAFSFGNSSLYDAFKNYESDIGWRREKMDVDAVLIPEKEEPTEYEIRQKPNSHRRYPNYPFQINMPARQAVQETLPVVEEQMVNWDRWYEQVAGALWQKWQSLGKEAGEANLRLKVDRQGNVSAQILKTSNYSDSFRQSLLSAVDKMKGSPVLAFPAASQRHSVSFDTRMVAAQTGPKGASSTRAGEVEKIYSRAK